MSETLTSTEKREVAKALAKTIFDLVCASAALMLLIVGCIHAVRNEYTEATFDLVLIVLYLHLRPMRNANP